MTWAILTEACPDLVMAGCADSTWSNDDLHNITRDLVWDQESVCGQCPRCPCNNGAKETYYVENYTTFGSSYGYQWAVCFECTCDYFFDYNNDAGEDVNVYGRVCDSDYNTWGNLRFFNTPDTLQDIQCPYTYTTAQPTPAPTGGIFCL